MRAICLQHVSFEGPGAFASALMRHGISIECHLVPENGLPQDSGDLLIVMGGPMSVNDHRSLDRGRDCFHSIRASSGQTCDRRLSGQPVHGKGLRAQPLRSGQGAGNRHDADPPDR